MDGWQILYTFIGSFLGFGSTLWTQSIIEKNKDKANKEQVRKNIMDELTTINGGFRKCLKMEAPVCIETPIWDSVISTGMILYFVEHEKDFYDKILNVYNRISVQKKLEDNYQNCKNVIKEFRVETSNCIDRCIGVINGNQS
jgi:DNA replication initiation complex subunit (GINS family)